MKLINRYNIGEPIKFGINIRNKDNSSDWILIVRIPLPIIFFTKKYYSNMPTQYLDEICIKVFDFRLRRRSDKVVSEINKRYLMNINFWNFALFKN